MHNKRLFISIFFLLNTLECVVKTNSYTCLGQVGHWAEILSGRQPGPMRSPAIISWPLMDKRLTNQLLGLGRDVISTSVAMLTGRCVMGRHSERMRLPLNDFCHGCRSAEKEENVIHFLCQCPSLSRCRYRLFGSPFLHWYQGYSFYIELSGWFSSMA